MPDCKYYDFLVCEKQTYKRCKEACYYGSNILGTTLIYTNFPKRIKVESCLLCNHFRGQGERCHINSRANFLLAGCNHWSLIKPNCNICKSHFSSKKCEGVSLCTKFALKLDRFGKFVEEM